MDRKHYAVKSCDNVKSKHLNQNLKFSLRPISNDFFSGKFSSEGLSFRGSILWNSLPRDTKIATSTCSFKSVLYDLFLQVIHKNGMERITIAEWVFQLPIT